MIRDMMWWTFVGDIYMDLCGEYGAPNRRIYGSCQKK